MGWERLKMSQQKDEFRVGNIKKTGPQRNFADDCPRKSSPKKRVMFFTQSEDTFLMQTPCIEDGSHDPKTLWGDPLLGMFSTRMTCSNCRHAILTKVTFLPSWRSYVATIVLSTIGCCCIPMHFKLYHHGSHYCPLCKVYLGHTGTQFSWFRPSHARTHVCGPLLPPSSV